MPRKPTANDSLRDTRRREILRAAARVFAERGIREAKVSDIAKSAGLSHGLIYHYFPSKDALLEAILEDKLVRMNEVIEQNSDAPVLEQIASGFETWMSQVASEPELALVITQAVVNRALPDPLRDRLASAAKAAFDHACGLIARGQASGEVTTEAPAEELTTAMIAMMRGLTLFHEVQLLPSQPVPRREVLLRMLRPLPNEAAQPEESGSRLLSSTVSSDKRTSS